MYRVSFSCICDPKTCSANNYAGNDTCRLAIVKNGSMYPTMEMMLRHSIQYLHLKGKAAISEPGNLDNEELLIKYMRKQQDGGTLNDEERAVAMSVFLLACIMDGDMGATQMELWARLVSIQSSSAAQSVCIPLY